MSKFSEKREESTQQAAETKGPRWVWIVTVLIVLAAAWMAYDYFYYRKISVLDGFAKCLTSKGVRMYGAWWCPHCADQKQAFGYAFQHVSYTECGIEGQPRVENEQCKKDGIQHFPTWQFGDGSRQEGVMPLAQLSQKTGCRLP